MYKAYGIDMDFQDTCGCDKNRPMLYFRKLWNILVFHDKHFCQICQI